MLIHRPGSGGRGDQGGTARSGTTDGNEIHIRHLYGSVYPGQSDNKTTDGEVLIIND